MNFSLSMDVRLLCFYHLQTVVGTKARAYAAVTANDGLFCLLIEVYRPHNTGGYAFAASDALLPPYRHPAPGALFNRLTGTGFHTRGLFASEAHNGHIIACDTAGCAHFDRTFNQGMVFLIHSGTNGHTGKTAETFIHFFRFQNFRHFDLPKSSLAHFDNILTQICISVFR